MNKNLYLTQQVINTLVNNNCKIITAESCTGGLLASLLTHYPGSSNWFNNGFVTYANNAKTEILGVKKELITKYGAVSPEVAIAMAEGALKKNSRVLSDELQEEAERRTVMYSPVHEDSSTVSPKQGSSTVEFPNRSFISIAITGIAGPDSDDKHTPIGFVCFAISMSQHKTYSYQKQFPAFSRDTIRSLACTEALNGLINYCPIK